MTAPPKGCSAESWLASSCDSHPLEFLAPSTGLGPGTSPEEGGGHRTKSELKQLRFEQRLVMRQLREVDMRLSDAVMQERHASRRTLRHQEMFESRSQHAAEIDGKIAQVREELQACERLPCQKGGTDANAWSSLCIPDGHAERASGRAERHVAWAAQLQPNSSTVIGESQAADAGAAVPMFVLATGRALNDDEGLFVKQHLGTAGAGELQRSTSAPSFPRRDPLECKGKQTAFGKTVSAARDDEAENAMRDAIRRELLRLTGGAREAFQRFDLNGSGKITFQEFADGVSRLGVKWMEITGLQKSQELFRLFDVDKDSVITFAELFPVQAAGKEVCFGSAKAFCSHWSRQSRDFQRPFRSAKWEPATPEEELQGIMESSQFAEHVATKKRWMSATIRRLKTRGKSDARCREIVALHLPRGTGPKDLQDVNIFSHAEVRACRKKYTDEWMDPMKRIQRVVGEIRDLKKDLRGIREELYTATEGKLLQHRAEEERRSLVSLLVLDRADPTEEGAPVELSPECQSVPPPP